MSRLDSVEFMGGRPVVVIERLQSCRNSSDRLTDCRGNSFSSHRSIKSGVNYSEAIWTLAIGASKERDFVRARRSSSMYWRNPHLELARSRLWRKVTLAPTLHALKSLEDSSKSIWKYERLSAIAKRERHCRDSYHGIVATQGQSCRQVPYINTSSGILRYKVLG